MKKIFFLSFILLLSAYSYSQNKKPKVKSNSGFHRCGTQYVMDELLKKYPYLKAERERNRKKILEQMQGQTIIRARTNLNYTIPVVIHVILPDPSVITNGQIQSQIAVLNADYQGKNADSTRIPAAFKGLYGKSSLRFCLAKKDPKGDPTDGIVRVTSSKVSEPGLEDPIKFSCTGGSDAWDPTKYLNIWVCDMGGDFLGYSFTPSDPLSVIPLAERGFVNHYQNFGKGGTATAPFNLGRTATHEIGHFFDLLHIWGPNNCGGGQNCGDSDEIGDTPNQESCTYGVPAADEIITDDCTTIAPGIMWMNFMDYVDDQAMVMYTPQQYNRMQAAIQATPWLLQLANSDACSGAPPVNRDIRVEGFSENVNNRCQTAAASALFSCSNSYRPSVVFTNIGSETIQSLTIEAKLDNANPVITTWNGSLLPNGQTSILLNPLSLQPGANKNLVIYTKNPNGQPDQRPFNDTIKAGEIIYPLGSQPLSEGFEQTTFPPLNWQKIDKDGTSSWERTTSASFSGTASMFINNFDNSSNDQVDLMISPIIPIGQKDSAFLTFQVAAATYSEPDLPGNPTDTLEILLTQDCGASYKTIYKKWGLSLVTTGNVAVDTSFIPDASSWRKESIFLGDFSNIPNAQLQINIKNTSNYENNIYIDDINIFTKEANPLLKEKGILVTPNPFRNQFFVQFYPAPVNLEYMQLFNMSGQRVWEKRISLGLPGNRTGPSTVNVQVPTLQTGLYILKMVYRNGTQKTYKLIKSN